jgi:hypothetical protein
MRENGDFPRQSTRSRAFSKVKKGPSPGQPDFFAFSVPGNDRCLRTEPREPRGQTPVPLASAVPAGSGKRRFPRPREGRGKKRRYFRFRETGVPQAERLPITPFADAWRTFRQRIAHRSFANLSEIKRCGFPPTVSRARATPENSIFREIRPFSGPAPKRSRIENIRPRRERRPRGSLLTS